MGRLHRNSKPSLEEDRFLLHTIQEDSDSIFDNLQTVVSEDSALVSYNGQLVPKAVLEKLEQRAVAVTFEWTDINYEDLESLPLETVLDAVRKWNQGFYSTIPTILSKGLSQLKGKSLKSLMKMQLPTGVQQGCDVWFDHGSAQSKFTVSGPICNDHFVVIAVCGEPHKHKAAPSPMLVPSKQEAIDTLVVRGRTIPAAG